MDKNRIKIGHQEQADLPIYLYKNGKLVCGKYEYYGKYIKKFSRVYEVIYDLVRPESSVSGIDVSMFKPWNAIEIYEEYIAKPWNKSIGAKSLERLSIETQVPVQKTDRNIPILRLKRLVNHQQVAILNPRINH